MGNIKLSELLMPVVKYKQFGSITSEPKSRIPAPAYATDGAVGIDLCADINPESAEWTMHPGGRVLVPTGLLLSIPKGYEGQVRPRSGLAINHGVTVLNAPGTIDADYRGEIKVILINHGRRAYAIKRGERIAQLVIAPVTTVTLQPAVDLDETERGEGGFGSTDDGN